MTKNIGSPEQLTIVAKIIFYLYINVSYINYKKCTHMYFIVYKLQNG